MRKQTDVGSKPENSAEGGLSSADEVSVRRDDQLAFFSELFRNVVGLPAEGSKRG